MKHLLPAIKGVQGAQTYFVVQIPFDAIERLTFVNPEVQRKIKPKKVKKYVEYVLENMKDFTFPSILLAATSGLTYNERTGELTIDDATPASVVDGQHRRGTIIELLQLPQARSLESNTIPAMIYQYKPTEKQADLFAVTNGEQTPVTKAQKEMRDYRHLANRVARDVIAHLSLNDKVSWMSMQVRPGQWFAFTWFVDANKFLLSSLANTDEFNASSIAMQYWQEVFRLLSPVLGSKGHAASTSLMFGFYGIIGKHIITLDDWRERLRGLSKVDWSREAWEGVLYFNGTMRLGRRRGLIPTAVRERIFPLCGITVDEEAGEE